MTQPLPTGILPTANTHPHLLALIEQARSHGPLAVAIAYPCDHTALQSAYACWQAGLMTPLLVGPRAQIDAVARHAQIDIAGFTVHDTAADARLAAALAAQLCRDKQAQALMKGSLHTDELLAAAMSKEAGLRGSRRASHVFVLDVPEVARPLLFTDCVVNIAPQLIDKRDIAQNAIDLAHAIGIAQPRMAILSAVESVNAAIPSTLDAAALCKMADRGQIQGAVLDGPLAYDNAISLQSAQTKGIISTVAGQADIFLMPNLEAGNIAYKQLIYMAKAECAGLALGLKVPIILTSRADSIASRIASCALAVLAHAALGTA